jgi:dihydrofolate reductase
VWSATDKIVYSSTLAAVSSARTRIERHFDTEAVRALKERASVSVGGPALAAEAIRAGLVDEYGLFIVPTVIGGGTPAFPDGARARLELTGERRFASGVVYLHYRARD